MTAAYIIGFAVTILFFAQLEARMPEIGGYPTTTEIEREVVHRGTRHAVLSLAMTGHLARVPFRKPYQAHRYTLTELGRKAIGAPAMATLEASNG